MKAEILTKVIVIFFMILLIVTLWISAWISVSEHYDQRVMTFHRMAGVLFLIILPIHIYLRREKLKKLLKEFLSILITGTLKQPCTNHALLKTFKQRPLQEFCTLLKLDSECVIEFLNQKQIAVFNIEDSLEKIAKENANDALKIFAMIIENHHRSTLSLDQKRYN
jgi:hypothetical protein